MRFNYVLFLVGWFSTDYAELFTKDWWFYIFSFLIAYTIDEVSSHKNS